jgi:hypothetical protein
VEAVGKKLRGLFAGFVGGGGERQGGEGGDTKGGATKGPNDGHGDGPVTTPGSNGREDAEQRQSHAENVPKRNRTIRLRFKRKDRVDTRTE